MIKKLVAHGIRLPVIEKMPWGLYWHEDVDALGITPQEMRDGHIAEDGTLFEWPDEQKPPIKLKMPNYK